MILAIVGDPDGADRGGLVQDELVVVLMVFVVV
jgi:hypothetical protein